MTVKTNEKNSDQAPRCEHCGKPIQQRTTWQKYCSEKCKVAAWRKQNKPAK